jgi:predicted dehydrogenase
MTIEIRLRHGEPSSVFVESMDDNASPSSPVVSDHRAHQAVLEDFIRAIETNSRPLCDGHEARRSLALIETIYKSCSATRSR